MSGHRIPELISRLRIDAMDTTSHEAADVLQALEDRSLLQPCRWCRSKLWSNAKLSRGGTCDLCDPETFK